MTLILSSRIINHTLCHQDWVLYVQCLKGLPQNLPGEAKDTKTFRTAQLLDSDLCLEVLPDFQIADGYSSQSSHWGGVKVHTGNSCMLTTGPLGCSDHHSKCSEAIRTPATNNIERKVKNRSLLQRNGSGAHPGAPSLGVKRPGREADDSPPYSA
jgi:hypothetical protein